MPSLKITLLNYPRLECDGQVVSLERRKALALIAYLAATERRHNRES